MHDILIHPSAVNAKRRQEAANSWQQGDEASKQVENVEDLQRRYIASSTTD